ncbi:hypothetical protein Tco_1471576 [Tanacetum coccineum]
MLNGPKQTDKSKQTAAERSEQRYTKSIKQIQIPQHRGPNRGRRRAAYEGRDIRTEVDEEQQTNTDSDSNSGFRQRIQTTDSDSNRFRQQIQTADPDRQTQSR